MLDFRVDTFLSVCRYLNYTKAAKELCITQPAVSQHIRYLESYYGQKLFVYNNKQLMLTEAGQQLKNTILSIKHDLANTKDIMGKRDEGKRVLKFGATLSIGELMLTGVLADYLRNQPGTEINYQIANTRQLLSDLDDGKKRFFPIV